MSLHPLFDGGIRTMHFLQRAVLLVKTVVLKKGCFYCKADIH
jgi:hypothetical protein